MSADPNFARPASRRALRTGLAALLLAGTTLGGFAVGHTVLAANTPDPTTSGTATPNTGASAAIQPQPSAARLADFSALVTQVRPAVVSITSHLRGMPVDETAPQLPPPFNQMVPQQRPRAIEARGSGFIIDADGTVVTNNHVVRGASSVSVTLDDGTTLPAKVIGTDPRTDIAVLRIDAGHKLPFITLGESDDARVGNWVVAMGNPFGLGGSVTAGIVSARGRDIGAGPYDNFIQVDAPINQGNSGGPLFTQDGKVVGINTAIISPTGGSVGIGFAIPSDTVRDVVAQLEKNGHVTRGYLGVEAQAIDPAMAAALGLKEKTGALVAAVQPNTPASKAGVQPGDLIIDVNGTAVSNPRELAVDVADVKPGEQLKLGVLRGGNRQTLTATAETLPDQQVADAGNGGAEHQANQPRLGLALGPLTPDVRSQLNLPEQVAGAVVAQVQPGSPADNAGLRPGDVVLGVGDKAVSSAQSAVSAIRAAAKDGHVLALRIFRDGHAGFVAIDPSQHTPQGPAGEDDDAQG